MFPGGVNLDGGCLARLLAIGLPRPQPRPSVPQTLLFSNQSQSAQLAPFSLKLVPPGTNPDGALLTTQSDQPGDPPQMTPREPERQALSNRTKQMTNGCAREKFFSDVGLGVRSLSEIKGERDEDAGNELEDAPPPCPAPPQRMLSPWADRPHLSCRGSTKGDLHCLLDWVKKHLLSPVATSL